MAKEEIISVVARLVQANLNLRFEGATAKRHERAQGYADGYMKALIDAGLVTEREMREIVGRANESFVTATA